MSIRGRLLMLAVGAVVPLLLVGLAALWGMWGAKQQQINEAMEQQAELAVVVFERWLDTQRQLAAILDELPPLYRAILLLQKRDGMSYVEIAKELDLSVHTVEKYLFRALALVRAAKWER